MRSKVGIALVVCGAAAALAITALVLLGGDPRQGGNGSKVGEGARAGTREVARGEPQVSPPSASRSAPGSSGEAAVSPQRIPAIWIVGKCVDIAGRAVVGAEIRSTDPNHPFVARSAADGRFAWLGESSEELAVERVNLEASAAGYAPSKRTTFVYGNVATEIPDLVLWRAARIDGIVRDEAGAPVSGADVWVQNLHESAPGPAAKSGPDGRFTAAAIARGETAVVAEHPKYGQSDPVTMDLAKSGDAHEVVVRFSREVLARSIAGSVVGPHGEPCPGASVAVQITHETGGVLASGAAVGPDGSFFFDARYPGTYHFRASDPKGRWSPVEKGGIVPGTKGVELRLGASREQGIVVLGDDRKPLSRFKLEVTDQYQSHFSGDVEPADHAGGRAVVRIPDEMSYMRILAPNYFDERLGPFAPGAAIPNEIVLRRSARARGRVFANGAPLADAEIFLHASGSVANSLLVNDFPSYADPAKIAATKTNENGEFTAGPPSIGMYYVRVEKLGFAPIEAGPFVLAPDAPVPTCELELRAGGALEGQVATRPGENAAGIFVGISRGDGFPVSARCDSEGRYRFGGLAPGRYVVKRIRRALDPAKPEWENRDSPDSTPPLPYCDIREGETTHFDLPAPADAATLVARVGGTSLAGARGLLVNLGDTRPTVLHSAGAADAESKFHLGSSNTGQHLFTIDLASEASLLQITEEISLGSGENAIERHLSLGRIVGTAAAPGDWIILRRAGAGGAFICGIALADAAGRFSFPAAPAGSYALYGAASGLGPLTVEVPERGEVSARLDAR